MKKSFDTLQFKLTSFSLPRAGSTLQINSFKAACNCFALNGLEISGTTRYRKHHASCFGGDINANHESSPHHAIYRQTFEINNGEKHLVVGMHRDLVAIIASAIRIRSLKLGPYQRKNQIKSTLSEYIQNIAIEYRFIPDIIKKGNAYHRDNYATLEKMTIQELLLSRMHLLKKAFKISDELYISTKSSLADNRVIQLIDEKYKLSKKAAKNYQKSFNSDEFKLYDKFTGIHANHLSEDHNDGIGLTRQLIREMELEYWVQKINDKSNLLMHYNTFIS